MPDLHTLTSLISSCNKTLFILCGFPYTGKSYVAKQLRLQTDIVFVSIDDIFHALGFDWNSNTLPEANAWKQIFNESYTQTKQALLDGKNVLYDSTNQTVASRDVLRAVAQTVDAHAKVVYIQSPVEVVWSRW